MLRIDFFNREKEMMGIMNVLNMKPTLITFVYGPINSGKTELINILIKKLPENYKIFYINLRGRFIRDYDEFIKVLFDIEREERFGRIKEFLKPLVSVLPESYSGIPIPKDVFLKLFMEKEIEDAFVYIETVLRAFYNSGYIPVLIIDELQVIGDVKVDDLLIYKIFNLFVRLTKELHLAHVFAITSDSLFIERVYSEAMLQGRCRYLIVDDFDKETTLEFLNKYNFSKEEKEIAWHYCGGKPVYLLELIMAKDKQDKAEELLKIRINQLEYLLDYLNYVKPKVLMGDEEMIVEKEHIMKILIMFKDKDVIKNRGIHGPAKHFLVKQNILFVDPTSGIVKPQSRLDLLAIKKVVEGE